MNRRDALAFLAFRAHAADAVTEGDLVEVLGLDRVTVRVVIDQGRALAEGLRSARVARAQAAVVASRAAQLGEAAASDRSGTRVPVPVDDELARLFADGRERTTGEVALAMRVSADTSAQRLRRSKAVERVRHGVWRKAGAA